MGGAWGNDLFIHPGYQYKGCYKDTATRALRYGPKAYGYYPATCSVACQGYRYFSLQHNGWCACESDWGSVTQYGTATNCPSNRMGSNWANDVFENIGYYQYIGCYRDTGDRALRYGPKAYGYNKVTCRIACNQYKYYALQDNGWCSCENDYIHATKYGTSTGCGSNGLGGGFANSLYENLQSNTALVAHLNVPIINNPWTIDFEWKGHVLYSIDFNTMAAIIGVGIMLIIIICYINVRKYRKQNKIIRYKVVNVDSTDDDGGNV